MKRILIPLLGIIILSGLIYIIWFRPEDHPELHGGDFSLSRLAELKSLPYLTWSGERAAKSLNRVTIYNRAKAYDGYNLYTDAEKYAYLIDMEGRIIHRWEFPGEGEWEYAELLGNGEIMAYSAGEKLVCLDRDSNIIRRESIPVHHDIAMVSDGSFWVPVSTPHQLYKYRLIQFDSILHLSPEWEKLAEWSSFSHLAELQRLHQSSPFDLEPDISSISAGLKIFYYHWISGLSTRVYEIDKWFRGIVGLDKFDYYHLNTVEVLPGTEPGKRDSRFAAGNILTCLRHADLILIFQPETGEVVWSWGPGILDWPHMPTMLENGHILVYDNGTHRGYSRIIELDPVKKQIVWEYRADPPEKFYSESRGSNQRLPNGNTLICESERGRVFEVTPGGEVVWEFYNPDISDDGHRRLIYRMMRVSKAEVDNWLEPQEKISN